MNLSRVLLLLAATACRCARNEPSGRNKVRFENKDKQLARSKNALMQANDGSSSGHIGVLSPRPDVIGPRDMARLTATRPARWAAARRVYESERDVAAEAEEVLKEYYENADPLVETGTTSQADYPLRYSAYMRGRSLDSANAQSDIPTTLSTTRSLTRPRTQPRTLGPNLSDYASQNVDRFVSTSIVDKELPFWSNSAPPQELDLPVFGDDLADNRDKSNLSEVTKGTEKPVSFVSTLRFRLDNEFSQHSSLSVPKKQRFENFVKFIQANKDLVDEYIKKKRGSYKASSRSNRAKGGPISLHRWGLDPVRQGITPPAVAGGPTSLPSVRGPEATLRKWMSQKSLVSTLPSPTTPVNHGNHQILRQDKGEQYSTTIDSRLLDLAPGRGRPIATMRLKGRICQRHVLLPEGPKYNKRGAVYLEEFKPIYDKDFPATRAPRYLLPICCNCCRKSVLGCE